MTKYKKNAQADFPDARDWIYRPALVDLKPSIDAPNNLYIRNQGREGACTGFAMAAVIDILKQKANPEFRTSARMLYEMAKLHDEWAGAGYEGSSLRGAIHGWRNMGVCEETEWPYFTSSNKKGRLSVKRARAARDNTPGAYYRIRPQISDFHAALNEVGAIAVSAQVHGGWDNPENGKIAFRKNIDGRHAFAIVGYKADGFLVQNSWGKSWGNNGVALWTYEDCITNVMDAWVFRLALPTPEIFGLQPQSSKLIDTSSGARAERSIDRSRIAGHFVHIDDGKFATRDRYWSDADDVAETADLVAKSSDYDHILFYGHGGLNSPNASARRIAAMKDVFKENRIYPFHIMYDTGLMEEIRDIVLGKGEQASGRAGGISDWLDRIIEKAISRPGGRIWGEMKDDAELAFSRQGAGTVTVNHFLSALRRPTARKKKIHLAGHSTGAVLFAHFIRQFSRRDITIESCTLMAPACTVDLYEKSYLPVLRKDKNMKIKQMDIYNLRDNLEQDDYVGSRLLYRKSLLYLVSNAFEEEQGMPLLGMENFEDEVTMTPRNVLNIHYSNGQTGRITRSTSHGGFDNDKYTLNSVLRTILKKNPARPFTDKDVDPDKY